MFIKLIQNITVNILQLLPIKVYFYNKHPFHAVKKYPLLKIALLYFLLGSLWLLAGAVVINWIDNQYPSVNLQGLHFFKNLIFLIATSVLVL
ncbi:hypothetical protein DBR11_21610, partial [Pedobacter sp. HMWF019]